MSIVGHAARVNPRGGQLQQRCIAGEYGSHICLAVNADGVKGVTAVVLFVPAAAMHLHAASGLHGLHSVCVDVCSLFICGHGEGNLVLVCCSRSWHCTGHR